MLGTYIPTPLPWSRGSPSLQLKLVSYVTWWYECMRTGISTRQEAKALTRVGVSDGCMCAHRCDAIITVMCSGQLLNESWKVINKSVISAEMMWDVIFKGSRRICHRQNTRNKIFARFGCNMHPPSTLSNTSKPLCS